MTAPLRGPGRRAVVVGASLAGLSAATELRRTGFTGEVVVVGDEPHLPYDRPPQSKSVLAGHVPAGEDQLPIPAGIDVDWRLGVPAARLDRAGRVVELADGTRVPYDGLVLATGTRARAWPDAEQAALDGVFAIQTREDGVGIRRALDGGVGRVVVVGAGFTGSEAAWGCRERGIPVTLVDRGPAPLAAALGETVGSVLAAAVRHHGVDLRTTTGVDHIDGAGGRVRSVALTDGTEVEADVVVTALGAVRNVEWLAGSGLVVDHAGVRCDPSLRAVDADGTPDPAVCAAGDVAAWPHAGYGHHVVSVAHWDNAVAQGRFAARTLHGAHREQPPRFADVPRFWSNQYGMNIKALGIPHWADEMVLVQGSLENRRCVLAYGRHGRTVAALALNAPREIEAQRRQIATLAPFPPRFPARDWRSGALPEVVATRFPAASHEAPADVVAPPPTDQESVADALGFPRDPQGASR